MKKHIWKIVIPAVMIVLAGCLLPIRLSADSNNILSDKIDGIMNDMEKNNYGNKSGLSSNPFDYLKDNPYYDKLLGLGTDALPVLEEKVRASDSSGLNEFILTIAATDIAKVDYKNLDGWCSAKDWLSCWGTYLKALPQKVNEIAASDQTNEIKNKELVSLGLPALPYIMDNISKGRGELRPAAEKLAQSGQKYDLRSLRKYVESKAK